MKQKKLKPINWVTSTNSNELLFAKEETGLE